MMSLKDFLLVSPTTLITERFAKLLAEKQQSAAAANSRPQQQKRKPTAPETQASSKKKKRAENPEAPSIEALEIIDLDVLRALHAQRATLLSTEKAAQTKFHNFYMNTMAAGGRRRVVYQQKLSGERFGRFSPCDGLSFQNMDCAWRDTLVRDRTGRVMYTQLDMRKAHQAILLSIAEQHGWPTPKLRYYMEHTDEVLEMLVFDREQAKIIMLMLLYGGDVEMVTGYALPAFVSEYRHEMKGIAARLYAEYPALVERLQIKEAREDKRLYVFMSRVLQDREAMCMQTMVAFLTEAGHKIGAVLHDGLMVLENTAPNAVAIDDAFLARMSTYMFEKCQIRNIEVRRKDFGAPLAVKLETINE